MKTLTQVSRRAIVDDLAFHDAFVLVPLWSSVTAMTVVMMMVPLPLPFVTILAFPLDFTNAILSAAADVVRHLHELKDILLWILLVCKSCGRSSSPG